MKEVFKSKTFYLLGILALALANCSDQKINSAEGIGSSLVDTTGRNEKVFSSTTYSAEANQIIERHRIRLKSILPQMLDDEITLYRKTLAEIEKIPVLTYNLEESQQLTERIQTDAAVSLVQHEIELNKIYFELFNELSVLNLKYDYLKKGQFKDYYDSGPIVLSDEVMLKIDELVKDEDKRVLAEDKKNKQDMAFAVFAIIPGTANCRGILEGVTQAAKHYKIGKPLNVETTRIAKISYQLLNKDVSNFISKTFKNNKIRSEVSQIGYVGMTAGGIKKGVGYISVENTNIVYKVLENKIKGRIGDFSDGILAVHIQRVRDNVKVNTQNIKN